MSEQPDESLELSPEDEKDLKGMYDGSFEDGEKDEQMIPLSQVEDIIKGLQLDLEVRTRSVQFVLQLNSSPDVRIDTTDGLIKAAKKIEEYIAQGTVPSE